MVIDSPQLKQAFAAATGFLERYRDTINALNVFPVPDGDTGTNMLLTMRSAMEKCEACPDPTAAGVADSLAVGAFWGARGNSGVILSQFLRGFADGLEDKGACSGADLSAAFGLATTASYKAVGQPVEGTMLSVIRSLSDATQRQQAQGEQHPLRLWQAAFEASKEALSLTPQQLPVLREAGVVDAGGMGIVVIVGGALRSFSSQGFPGQDQEDSDLGLDELMKASSLGGAAQAGANLPRVEANYLDSIEEVQWGYCTQFVISGEGLDLEAIRQRLNALAHSTVVVGDQGNVRIHLHASDPGPAISYGVSLGQLSQFKIENMGQQNQDFVAGHRTREETSTPPVESPQNPPLTEVAVVAVAAGEGLSRLFHEYGCAAVITGGQTKNPSVLQLVEAARTAQAKDVIVLPNNKNILVAAEQAAATPDSHLHVVASRTVPQGVAALLAFNPEETLERNLKAMTEALSGVTTIEVTQAVRDTTLDGFKVNISQYIALQDGRLTAVGNSPEETLQSALDLIALSCEQVVTLFWGKDARQSQAEALQRQLQDRIPGIQVDLVPGGQPHYSYLASVE